MKHRNTTSKSRVAAASVIATFIGTFSVAPASAMTTTRTTTSSTQQNGLSTSKVITVKMVSANKYAGGKYRSRVVPGSLKYEKIDLALPVEPLPKKRIITKVTRVTRVKVLAQRRAAPAQVKPSAAKAAVKPAQKPSVREDLATQGPKPPASRESMVDEKAPPLMTNGMLSTRIQRPTEPAWNFVAQLKNRITSGRKHELEVIGGKNYSLKNELVLGVKHASGWGISAVGGVSQKSYDDKSKDKSGGIDPYLMVHHPSFYKDSTFNLYGWTRMYFPLTESSQAAEKYHYAYASLLDVDLGSGWSISNAITPHYYTRKTFQPSDTFLSLEFETDVYYKITDWMTAAIAPYTQVEMHDRTAPGTTVEIMPFIDFKLSKHVLIEPKLYLPVYVDGVIDGGASSASLRNIYAELYLKLSI